jgi:polyisoprenoid-binding protein YceI
MQAQKQNSVGQSQSVWRLDQTHTTVEFTVKKLFFLTVNGRLTEFDGTIVLDEEEISRSSVEANIETASFDTGNARRDRHVKTAAFLDVSNYPSVRFKSLQVGPGKDRDTLTVKGALTIKDTSKEVVLDVTEVDRSKSPNGGEVIYYVAMTELDRFDFGVNQWRGVIGSKLKVVINVQANRV